MASTNVECEHCHAELGPGDIVERGEGTHRCKRCGGRALRNRVAVADVYETE